MSPRVSRATDDKYINMHSTSRGAFRVFLDRLLLRLRTPSSPPEARALALLAVEAAKRWEAGGHNGYRDDIARDLGAKLDEIKTLAVAADYAAALVKHIGNAKPTFLVAVVVGEAETAVAHRMCTSGQIGAYVSFADTDAGVTIDRRCSDPDNAALLDTCIEATVADFGGPAHELPIGAKA